MDCWTEGLLSTAIVTFVAFSKNKAAGKESRGDPAICRADTQADTQAPSADCL